MQQRIDGSTACSASRSRRPRRPAFVRDEQERERFDDANTQLLD